MSLNKFYKTMTSSLVIRWWSIVRYQNIIFNPCFNDCGPLYSSFLVVTFSQESLLTPQLLLRVRGPKSCVPSEHHVCCTALCCGSSLREVKASFEVPLRNSFSQPFLSVPFVWRFFFLSPVAPISLQFWGVFQTDWFLWIPSNKFLCAQEICNHRSVIFRISVLLQIVK